MQHKKVGFFVWGLGLGAWGLGFGVGGVGVGGWGLGVGVWGLGVWGSNLECRVSGEGFSIQGTKARVFENSGLHLWLEISFFPQLCPRTLEPHVLKREFQTLNRGAVSHDERLHARRQAVAVNEQIQKMSVTAQGIGTASMLPTALQVK
jgi:hypothetical protein